MSVIPTDYCATAIMEPLKHFEVWAFGMDASHVDVGDTIWVDTLDQVPLLTPTKRSYADTYKVKEITWSPEYRVLTFHLGWGRKVRAYPDDRVWVACPDDTRGHTMRDDNKFNRRKALANDQLAAKRAKGKKAIR